MVPVKLVILLKAVFFKCLIGKNELKMFSAPAIYFIRIKYK